MVSLMGWALLAIYARFVLTCAPNSGYYVRIYCDRLCDWLAYLENDLGRRHNDWPIEIWWSSDR